MLSWVRCGTLLYQFLIFALLSYSGSDNIFCPRVKYHMYKMYVSGVQENIILLAKKMVRLCIYDILPVIHKASVVASVKKTTGAYALSQDN